MNIPVTNCTDNGCKFNWNQLGECVDITNPNWKELDNMYDLSQIANGTSSGLCGVSADESCCRCMKKKTTKKTQDKPKDRICKIHICNDLILLSSCQQC